jgi:PAS domain S-box-containing protein
MPRTYNILVIDDNEGDRIIIRVMLRAAGVDFEMEEAPDGTRGLILLTEKCFDCIFLDYRLLKEDGRQVLHEIRKHGIRTPIIMLTGYGNERLAVELMKAGATDYLSKMSLSPENLGRSLRNAVRISESEMQSAIAEGTLSFIAKAMKRTEEGLILTDGEGNIQGVNQTFCIVTGYSPPEVLGRNPRILKSGLHNTGFYRQMRESLKKDGQWSGEIWNRRKNGEVYLQWLSVSALVNENHETVNYAGVFIEITGSGKNTQSSISASELNMSPSR